MIHDVVHPAVEVFNEVIKNVLVTTDGLLWYPAMSEQIFVNVFVKSACHACSHRANRAGVGFR